jgi:acyl-[acyl-carrier-protein]-phospholipid O-acyltransferase/long-chain-fatty-acid--[acyl-carrier-protein] ligase
VFSFSDGRYFFKLPTGLQRRVTVSFGAPIDPERATAEVVRERILEMGADAMSRRTGDDLTSLVVSGLRRAAARKVVIEHDGSHLRGITALALACLLARRWAGLTPSPRVGVILPPGCAGLLANIALLIAGKTPANLNPLTPAPVLADCLHRANITTVITATPVREKLRGVPWPQSVILIDREIRSLPRRAILSGHLRALFAPIRPPRNPEAALLFTSGSSGRPKGVLLTHANVVANITQISETNFLQRDDRLLTALPLFHSFGLTVGLILPVVRGIPIITAPSPLDADKIRDAARVGCPTLALATPTFLRHYIQRIPRDAFGTLRLALVGAERLCPKLAAAFTDRFGCDVVEGYGLTEASPVVAFNQPHPRRGLAASSVQHGHLRGTVGRLLPGIAARANDGILALRGPNVISHYMNNECPEAFAEGWFRTGDRVAFDPNGFLRIEGRAARFSKIGGEMVSHAAVEASIAAALDESPGEDCVVAVECPRKGEALVLVTTRRIETEVLRRALRDREIPNLWIPAEVVSVESVPMLASGKVDVAQCRAIVAHCHDIHR